MPMTFADFNNVASTTLANYRNKFEDNLSTNIALWYQLKRKGRIKEDGGESIVVPLMYGTNTTSGSYADYDALDVTPQNGFGAARYTWKGHNVTVSISGMERRKNAGSPEKVIDLLGAKVKQAEISAQEDFDVMFLADGTGNAGKDFLGLAALVGDHNSGVTTVGGIDAVAQTWWRSYIERNGGVDKALTLKDMGTAFYSASRGTSKPDFGLTTLALYQALEALIHPAQRYKDTNLAEVGFDNIAFHGAPITWGDNVVAKTLTFTNSTYLQLVTHPEAWLTPTDSITPYDKDAFYKHILSMGELTISNRKLGGSRLENRIP